MPFLCCQSAQTAVDPACHRPLDEGQGSEVIATVEALSPRSSNETGNPDEPFGLVFKEGPLNDRERQRHPKIHHVILVESIRPDSPFQQTPLRGGMRLVQINNTDIENQSLAQVKHILQNSEFPLRLIAQIPSRHEACSNGNHDQAASHPCGQERAHSASPKMNFAGRTILAVAHKEKVDETLGFSLKRSDSGTFTVDKIDPTSPFYPHETSLLREGMIVTSINGLLITGMDMEVAMSAIRDAPGSVVLAADIPPSMEEPHMIRKRIVATVCKRSPSEPLGLSLIQIPQGATKAPNSHHKKKKFTTVVGRIAPSCPFRDTDLDVGMEITSINGMDVSKSDARAMVHFLQECWGKIVVLAEMDVPVEGTLITQSLYSEEATSSSWLHHPDQCKTEAAASRHDVDSDVAAEAARGVVAARSTSSSPAMVQPLGNQNFLPPSQGGWAQQGESHPNDTSPSIEMHDERRYSLSDDISAESSTANSNPRIFTASAVKLSADHFLGVALKEDSLGSFFVSQMSPDSPFQATNLQVGAEIMSINGVQVAGLGMAFISNLLRSIVGTVALEFLLPTSQDDGYSETTW